MSDRKITAPGPGWRMPGRAKSTSIRDAMPNLLNAMGDSIERSNKMDFGTPGIHTQNGFQQPHEQSARAPIWVILTGPLATGTYSVPSVAMATVLDRDNSIGENALREGTEVIEIWNYSSSFAASSGDWVMAMPFGSVFVAIPSSGAAIADIINFEVVEYIPLPGEGLICDFVYASVTRASCGSSVVVGDIVLIADPNFQVFNFPVARLVGTRGMATWMKVDDMIDQVTCPELIYGLDLTCIWVAQHAFCGEPSAYV